jgi:hypothetical protein
LIETVMANTRPCRCGSTERWRMPNIAMMKGAEKSPAANIATMSTGTDPASGTAISGIPESAVKATT